MTAKSVTPPSLVKMCATPEANTGHDFHVITANDGDGMATVQWVGGGIPGGSCRSTTQFFLLSLAQEFACLSSS